LCPNLVATAHFEINAGALTGQPVKLQMLQAQSAGHSPIAAGRAGRSMTVSFRHEGWKVAARCDVMKRRASAYHRHGRDTRTAAARFKPTDLSRNLTVSHDSLWLASDPPQNSR